MSLITYAKLTMIGLISGGLGGVVGGGADAVIVPMLVALGVVSNYKMAVGTSLAMLLPPVGLFAVWKYYKSGNVKIWYAVWLALMFTLGSWLLSNVGVKLNKKRCRKIYAFFLISIAFIIFLDEDGHTL